MNDATVARRVTVHGDVQGVFFRDSTRQEASRRGVTGWVRNTPAGTVEAWLEGAASDVDALESWMHEGGPRQARVEHVDVVDTTPEGHREFAVR